MKKIFTLFILSILLLSQVHTLMANPFTTRLTSTATNIEAGQSFTVTFEVRGSAGIYGLTSNLNYDTNKLEITGSSAQSGFALTLGSKIVVDHTELQSGNFNFARITFKAKAGFVVGESTQISISNVVGSDGTKDVSGSGSNVTINLVPPKSTNNFLSNLETNAGGINFNKNTLSYTLIVDNNVTSANITGTPEDPKAIVSGLGNKTLRVYSNTFNIIVTAESGATRRYSLNIIRRDENGNAGALSTNNALRNLVLDVCVLNFSADVLDYSCEVDNLVDTFELGSEVADNKASVSREGPDKLALGPNVIKLTVTAESGDVRVYTVTITRSTSAPTVSLDKLEEALKTIESDEIGIIAPENGVIDQSVLSLIRDAKKTLVVKYKNENGKTLYEWHIDGSKANPAQPIKTLLQVSTQHSTITDQTNYTQGLILSFEKNPNLPNGTKLKYYLDETFSQFSTLNLYYFNPNTRTLDLKHEGLVVEDNYVWIPLEHTSEYFLTPARLITKELSDSTSNPYLLWIALSVAQFVVIIILGLLIMNQRKRRYD
jgi:hypothetical protein